MLRIFREGSVLRELFTFLFITFLILSALYIHVHYFTGPKYKSAGEYLLHGPRDYDELIANEIRKQYPKYKEWPDEGIILHKFDDQELWDIYDKTIVTIKGRVEKEFKDAFREIHNKFIGTEEYEKYLFDVVDEKYNKNGGE